MALNSEQNLALQHVAEGHNVLLMGSAGTGKSFLIKKIVDTVRKSGKNVYVTATTGIASSHYTDASTIHRWSGIGDGRLSIDDLKDVINNNKQYSDAKKRVLETDLLIIDECSMMSRKFFDSLNVICQLRNPALLFGGIQLLLAGDFKQLPPVPNILYGDEGEFCFTSRIFDKVFPHKIVLKTVIRQSEIPLIKAIDECAMGIVSPESIEFIKNLNRMLPPDTEKTTMLFSTNEQVDDFNRRSIIEHPGQIFEFNSVDSGEKRYLDRINVPKVLWLKIGAPVILMRNLTDKLVNGMQGVISGITKNGPVVKFSENELPIPKVKCTVFSPSKNMDVAVREQYPIKLAFAISIHKSQGMTLNRVEINCKGIFKPGQLAVAMGRCRSSKGLKVVNFTPSVCLPQPFEVQNFLSNLTSLPGLQDTSCCKALCVDNSDYMRNGDFVPTRLQAQQDAVNLVCHSKTRSNPENNVGLIVMSNVEVLTTLTADVGKILSKLHQVQPKGNIRFCTAVKVAHLALKHRQGKNHRMRIVVFVGSPIDDEEKDIVKLAKKLKKEKVNVDVINFGEESINTEKLTEFINTINGKDGTGSHLVTVPPGPLLSEALVNSPVIVGEDGQGVAMQATGFEFGVDPNEDPELALALRVSMEEQRARQEEEARKVQTESAAEAGKLSTEATNEEALLEQAISMSMGGPDQQTPSVPDFGSMSEEDQIAFAMQMSMQSSADPSSSNTPAPMDTDDLAKSESENKGDEDYSEVMNDQEFLQQVLENLPGVDPNSEAIRNAMSSLTKDTSKKDDKKDSEKK